MRFGSPLPFSGAKSTAMKVLLIEDEPKMLRSLQQGLEEQGLATDIAADGEAGRLLADKNDYAVIVSDIIMPGLTGLELVQYLRQKGNNTPIILLTALGQTDDKVAGFEAGADDYLTKPFEFRELLVRIRALARRPVDSYHVVPMLRYGDIEMHLNTKECFRAGQKIPLTPREYDLMAYFLRNPERVISKTEISEQVWDLHFDTGTNIVEVYVNFLRKKIEKSFDKKLIHTQFKNGYIFREE